MSGLAKLTIKVYADKQMQGKEIDEFVLPINPENYSRSLSVNLDESQAQGSSGNDSKNDKTKPEEIKLDFFLDNTNTVMGNHLNGMPVSKQVEKFVKLAYDYDGKIHQPNYLKLCWDVLVFRCKLKDVSINYTLFDSNGAPLRAKLSATFQEFIEEEQRTRKENKQSPDLTHIRRVEGNTRLDNMTFDIYGSDKQFLQIANANNLTSPRLLRESAQLIFPPIIKTN